MTDTAINVGSTDVASAAAGSAPVVDHLLRCIGTRTTRTEPYRHWLLSDVLPAETCDAVLGLPFEPAPIDDTLGRRETHNSLRVFFAGDTLRRFPVCEEIAAAFQSSTVVRALERAFGNKLSGGLLRIEYCRDVGGFWLEPHRDVSVKLITMQVYLSQGPDAAILGTDIYLDKERWFATAPCAFNGGFVFVPGEDTWHGFRKRSFRGIRRSLIINYVTPDWRSRRELAYPDHPVS